MRTYALQYVAGERGQQNAEPQGQRQPDARRGRYAGLPDSSGYGSQGDNGAGAQDNLRRQGKLSPEERRALRRQIDEAGHDIYSPKR